MQKNCSEEMIQPLELKAFGSPVTDSILDCKAREEAKDFFVALVSNSASLPYLQNTMSLIYTMWKMTKGPAFAKLFSEVCAVNEIPCNYYFLKIHVVEKVCEAYICSFMDWLMYYWNCLAEEILAGKTEMSWT